MYYFAQERAFELFGQNYGSDEKVLIKLAEELGGTDAPRHVRTVARWRKEWREAEQLDANLGILVDDNASEARVTSTVQYTLSARLKKMGPAEPSSVPDLVRAGVPPETAPRMLADWDMAYDRGDAFQTRILEKVASMFSDLGNISYAQATALATLEIQAEHQENPEAEVVARLARRYVPWEGRENRTVFQEMLRYRRSRLPGKRKSKGAVGNDESLVEELLAWGETDP